MELAEFEHKLLYAPNDSTLIHKLLKKASQLIENNEFIDFMAVTKIKICDSLYPQKFNWDKAVNGLIVISNRRIIIGYKTMFSVHFEEILPQVIKKNYFRTLHNVQSLCIATSTAAMAVEIKEDFIENAQKAISKIENVTSESSRYAKSNYGVSNPPDYFKFEDFDKNGRHILKIYTMSVSGMKGEQNIQAQQILKNIRIGEQIILAANETSPELCSVKVKTSDGAQIGWLKNGQTLEDRNYRYDIFCRLERGDTVLARVCSKDVNKSGKINIKIDVARYAAR